MLPGRHNFTVISEEAETRAWFDWTKAISLIQCVCACTCCRNVVACGVGSFASWSGIIGFLRSRSRFHAHITPSLPPEYLRLISYRPGNQRVAQSHTIQSCRYRPRGHSRLIDVRQSDSRAVRLPRFLLAMRGGDKTLISTSTRGAWHTIAYPLPRLSSHKAAPNEVILTCDGMQFE